MTYRQPQDGGSGAAAGLPTEARLAVSPARHFVAVAMFAVLALLLLNLAVGTIDLRPASGVFFAVLGAVSAYATLAVWRNRNAELLLTKEDLRSSTGEVICRIDDVNAVERGVFAFKPSGGFVLRLRTRQRRAWVPGVWWRVGRSVGIGGVTIAPQARAMADLLSARLADR